LVAPGGYDTRMTDGSETPDLIPIAEAEICRVKSEPLDTAIESLHILERRTRIAKDDGANTLVCREIVSRCISDSRWSELGTNLTILAKRRGFSRRAISESLKLALDALPQISDDAVKLTLVKVLHEVTSGKIFLEVERARLTRLLVADLESKGELVNAMNMLQDLRLEILTSMDMKERQALMLLQFRLCLEANDTLRATLCSEKIKDQKIEDDGLRLQFLELLIRYHENFTREFLPLAESWFAIYSINNDGKALLNGIVYGVLAGHTPEQRAYLQKLKALKDISLFPEGRAVLGVFLGQDLVPWPEFEPKFRAIIPDGCAELMRKRVIEHSLRVVAAYYTRIRLSRLAELEQISVDELENRIIDLVFNEGFYAKIDRPQGVITFQRKQKESEVGDEFASNIRKLCKLVDHTHALIEKEVQGVHRAQV
jgi:hypothetical protein